VKSTLLFISLVSISFSSDIDYQDKYNEELIKNQPIYLLI